MKDLFGLPLFASEQSWYGEIKDWAGKDWEKLQLEGSFRLSYNGSVFAGEGLGYLLTFDHLVDTSKESGMCFVPLVPKLTTRLYLVYKKYQTLTPLAERFLQQVRQDFPLS